MAVNSYGYGAYGLQAYNSSYPDAPQVSLNGQAVTNFPSGTYSGGFTVSNVTEGAQLVTTEASLGFVLESETLHLFQVLSGTRYYIKNAHSGLYLRWNAGGGYTDQVGSGGSEIHWTFVPLGDGTFHVLNQSTGGMLEVPNASTSGGGWLTVAGAANGSERWGIAPFGPSKFALVNINSNLPMEIVGPYNPGTPASDATLNSGQKVDQWPDYGGEAQRWVLQTAP